MSYPRSSLVAQTTTQALTGVADSFVFTPVVPVEILSFGYIITTKMVDSGTGFVAKLDKRTAAGSDTGRTVGTYGTLTLTTAQVAALAAVGSVIRSRRVLYSTSQSTAFTNSGAPAEAADVALPGQEAVLNVTTALGSAGYGIPFVEYKCLPRQDRASTIELIVTS